MRRHVENPEGKTLGPIAFFIMWALALMALSVAAHGQTKQQSPSTVTQQPVKTDQAESAKGDDQITLSRFIIISIPDRQLALVDDGQVVKIYPIAVGAKHTPSPEGTFTVVRRVTDPAWTHKGKTVAPGKDNPVGSRWIGLSLKGYGIHGTNAPRSIGKAASHGCFRMGKKDIEELFTLVRVGDTVSVHRERDELVAQVFGGGNNEVQVAASGTETAAVDGGQN